MPKEILSKSIELESLKNQADPIELPCITLQPLLTTSEQETITMLKSLARGYLVERNTRETLHIAEQILKITPDDDEAKNFALDALRWEEIKSKRSYVTAWAIDMIRSKLQVPEPESSSVDCYFRSLN